MTTRRALLLLTLFALSACGVRSEVLGAPQVLLQALTLESATTMRAPARLKVLLQNVSNVAMRFSELDYQLEIAGQPAGKGKLVLDLEVPPNSPEALNTEVQLAPEVESLLSAGQTLEYTLKGTISSSKPSVRFEFLYQGRLSPTPGKPGEWR